MQLNLIEEDHLTCLRMRDDCRRKLANTQTVFVLPLEVDCSPAAVLFHFRSILSLKKTLPAHIQLVSKVTNVHQTLVLESIANVWIELLIDLPAIHDGCFTAALSRLDAIKPNPHGPSIHVRALIVKKNSLVRRVGRRGINLSTLFFARQIAVVAKQI